MAYRSWLKDVRRLDDLAKSLHHFPHSHRDWDREWEYEKREIAHIQNPFWPANLDPASYRFFEGWLHDGYVFGAERVGEQLEITVSFAALDMFCDEYFAEVEEEKESILSPVRLAFENVNYMTAVRIDPEGWLKWDDWSRWRSIEDLRCADTFLRGYFYEQDGKVQWVGHFYKWVEGTRKDPWNIYILVDCERVTAKPESARAIRKKIGDQAYEVWSYFSTLPGPEPWHEHGYLRRYLEEKGIAIRHVLRQPER